MNVLLNSHNSHILFFPFPPSVLSFALWLALPTVTRQLLQFQASQAQMTMPRGREETVSSYAFAFQSRENFPRIPPAGFPSYLIGQNWPSGPSPQAFTGKGNGVTVSGLD